MDNHHIDQSPSRPSTSSDISRGHDLDLTLPADDTILEESPVDNKTVSNELENAANGESSYESSDELPNGTTNIASSRDSDNLANERSSEGVGVISEPRKISYLKKFVIGIAVCVLLVSIAIALWFETADGVQPDLVQNFTSENNDVAFNLAGNVSNGSEKVVGKEEITRDFETENGEF